MATDRNDLRRRLNRLAYAQAGYFTAAQALDVGYSYPAQKHHADRGNWLRIDRGLYRLPDWPSSPHDAYVRWCLWSGGRAVVSHESALSVHELSDLDPATIHLTAGPDFYARDEAVTIHTGTLSESDVEPRQGWAVTTPLRSILDVAAGDVSQEHVTEAVRGVLAAGLVSRRRLLARSDEAGARGALRVERALASIGEGE